MLIINYLYLAAMALFIMSLRGLSSPSTSRRGNIYGMLAMVIVIIATIANPKITDYISIIIPIIIGALIGTLISQKIKMTALPQLVAAFHSLVGLAAVCIGVATFYKPEVYGIGELGNIHTGSLVEMSIGIAIGAITFSGSIIAFAKLQGLVSGNPLVFKGQHILNALLILVIIALVIALIMYNSASLLWIIVILSFILGGLIILPIGGADMPVVVSMLNSYSGWATSGIGFTLQNPALIVVGALVGSSGAILSYIMCKAMNRSIINVILGGFGNSANADATPKSKDNRPVKSGSADDAAFIMKNASNVIIVPGYGMAVAQAQHILREMADKLKKEGITVSYAIHPVAGRMPGHMNVLLAEANVPYNEVFELEEINHNFSQADVAFVIGANDVTNPAAKTDKSSPIYGMPVLDVDKAKTVLFIKRSMASGYAGVENPLFFQDNTMMLFGDARAVVEKIVQALDSI